MRTLDSRSRWLGLCLLGLAASLAALSLLGPLVTGVIHWRIRATILSQLYGLDTVSLAVVAPVAAVAGPLSLRGRPVGALLGFAPAAYAMYMVPRRPPGDGRGLHRLPTRGEARRGLFALTGWFALVGAAVAGMAIAMQLRNDPAMSVPQVVLMVVLGGVLVALAAALHAPALRRTASEPASASPTAVRTGPVAVPRPGLRT